MCISTAVLRDWSLRSSMPDILWCYISSETQIITLCFCFFFFSCFWWHDGIDIFSAILIGFVLSFWMPSHRRRNHIRFTWIWLYEFYVITCEKHVSMHFNMWHHVNSVWSHMHMKNNSSCEKIISEKRNRTLCVRNINTWK